MNLSAATACLALSLPLSLAAQGNQGSPATLFPAHTYVYLQLDPVTTVEGAKHLKLAKLLEDPMLGGLAKQAVDSLPPQSDPRELLQAYPFDRCIRGDIAIGVVGFTASRRATTTAPAEIRRFPESGTVSRDVFRGSVRFEPQLLLAIDVSDESLFLETLAACLGDVFQDGDPLTPELRDVEGVELQVWPIPGLGELLSTFVDGHFVASRSSEVLQEAVTRHKLRSASLATRTDFSRFAKHRGQKPTAAVLHVGLDSSIDMFSQMIPAGEREEIREMGGFDIAGLQLGMGFHEGGVCEWLNLAFADNPSGVLLNLARLWPSTSYVEAETSRGSVYAASLTFDWTALYNVTDFVLGLCEVDTSEFTAEANAALGVDLHEDLLGSIGNTIGAIAVLPRIGFIPELAVVIKVRDRAKMEALLAKVTEACKHNGVKTKKFTVSGGGPKATYLSLGRDIPIKPAFALSGDRLVISTMPLTLKSALRKDRGTGETIVDLLPDPTRAGGAPLLSYFLDPAPIAENLYADLLKVIDSSGRSLPIDLTDLPAADFVASSLSQFGVEFAVDTYSMSLDLHSPTGFTVPLVAAMAIAKEMEKKDSRPIGTTNE